MAGRPVLRARALLANPQAIRQLSPFHILTLCRLVAGNARRNPSKPGEKVEASTYITERYNFLVGLAQKARNRYWEDELVIACARLLDMKDVLPVTGEEAKRKRTIAAWDALAEAEFEDVQEKEMRKSRRESGLFRSSSPDKEAKDPFHAQESAEAKVEIEAAAGHHDLPLGTRGTLEQEKSRMMRHILSYLPLLDPDERHYYITVYSGSLNRFLNQEIDFAEAALQQVKEELKKGGDKLPGHKKEELVDKGLRFQRDLAEAKRYLAIVAAVDATRPVGLPPGDIPGEGDEPLVILEGFYPDSADAVRRTKEMLKETYFTKKASKNPARSLTSRPSRRARSGRRARAR